MKNEALEVLKNRRAIRKFKKEQIKEEELNAVLKAGTYAPTGMGLQTPLIVAVQNQEDIKETISKLTDEMLKYAESMEFEKAAEIRDKIKELENLL